MKPAIIAGDFYNCNAETKQTIDLLCEKTGCDVLIALISGSFDTDGPAVQDVTTRTAWLLANGVDLVLEKPAYTTLTDVDLYAFSSVSLLTKLGLRADWGIPCEAGAEQMLPRLVSHLLVTDQRFKNQIFSYIDKGFSFFEARAHVLEKLTPGAKDVLLSEENNYAVEYIKSVKYCYSPIRPLLLPGSAKRKADTRTEELASVHNRFSEPLFSYLTANADRLEDVWGCPTSMARLIRANLSTFKDFVSFSEQVSSPRHAATELRQIFYRMLLGLNRAEFTLLALNDYALYANVLGHSAGAGPLLDSLCSTSTIPLIIDGKENKPLSSTATSLREIDLASYELVS